MVCWADRELQILFRLLSWDSQLVAEHMSVRPV